MNTKVEITKVFTDFHAGAADGLSRLRPMMARRNVVETSQALLWAIVDCLLVHQA
ncbi:hypothetical protein [Streptomyces sp. AS02]|uniref:hypothetical protein n=1 Tax=Streptomyces sp. AS02 TaxID=2938946 RepID=UPI00202222A0|nr:hypothetical protein [Streptomyces sp. AS02]MCL8011311.1 hypothetical protein [Streptomyces sp. AS02]